MGDRRYLYIYTQTDLLQGIGLHDCRGGEANLKSIGQAGAVVHVQNFFYFSEASTLLLKALN